MRRQKWGHRRCVGERRATRPASLATFKREVNPRVGEAMSKELRAPRRVCLGPARIR